MPLEQANIQLFKFCYAVVDKILSRKFYEFC